MINIVFYLSKPSDFFPLYESPVPLELVEFNSFSLFGNLYRQISEIFPKAEYFLIGGKIPHSQTGNFPFINKFNIPASNIFVRLVLFSSFIIANQLNPFTFFLPAGLFLEEPAVFMRMIRYLSENPVSVSGFTVIGGECNGCDPNIEASDMISSSGDFKLAGIKRFLSSGELKKLTEKGYDRKDGNRYYGWTGIFSFNSMNFGEIISSYDKELHNLFYLLINSWKDGRSVQTGIHDIASELENYNLTEILTGADDKFLTLPALKLEVISSIKRINKILPADGQGNYVDGKVEIDGIYDSIIINKSEKPVLLKNLKNVFVISGEGAVRIENIEDCL